VNIFREKSIWLLWIAICLSVSRPAIADDLIISTQLKVKPASCVALHRGQLCFQNIRFFWEAIDELEYCLYSDTHERLLFCANGDSDEFIHDYASETSESFSLRLSTTGLSVATITVNTAWVYRTGKRSSSGWRLF
jgi:hypothetical protein